MTLDAAATPLGAPVVPPDAAEAAELRRAANEPGVEDAAAQFESLLLSHLVQVMTSSIGENGLFGDSAGAGVYASMFQQNLAQAMSDGGGIGLRDVFVQQLAPDAYRASQIETGAQPQHGALRPADFRPRVEGSVLASRPASGAALPGMTGRLQAIARDMLPDGFAAQWGVEGRLTEDDLGSDFSTEGPHGAALFNVRDAAGFEDCYKCNLFAFEMARRAGFQVPLVGRTRGWGFMGPDGVTADASRGQLRGDWGRVVTGEDAASLDSAIVRGERAFLLTGSSVGDRAGHMGIVERVHEVDYDDDGRIERVVFDGWEGRAQGASRLVRRTWNRYGNPGGEDSRDGFERIEIVELRRPQNGSRPEVPTHSDAHPSVHDTFFSRPAAERPMGPARSPE